MQIWTIGMEDNDLALMPPGTGHSGRFSSRRATRVIKEANSKSGREPPATTCPAVAARWHQRGRAERGERLWPGGFLAATLERGAWWEKK